MGKLLVVLLALLAPSFAAATPMQDQHGQWWDVLIPHSEWLDRPLPGPVEVFYLETNRVDSICSSATGHAEQFGCTFPRADRCEIYIAKELPKPFRDIVQLHEDAHCRGWGADHSLAPPPKMPTPADSLPDWPDKPMTAAEWFDERWAD